MNAALQEERQRTHRVSRTFALVCRLLPRAVRDDVYLLYLVFRTLDDLVDARHPEAAARVAAVAAWAAGRPAPRTPEVGILETLTARHALHRAAIGDFCAGMRQDLARAWFATETSTATAIASPGRSRS
jgi:phytoene synthase